MIEVDTTAMWVGVTRCRRPLAFTYAAETQQNGATTTAITSRVYEVVG